MRCCLPPSLRAFSCRFTGLGLLLFLVLGVEMTQIVQGGGAKPSVRIPSGDGFGFTGTDVRKLACKSRAKTNSTLVGGKRDTSSAPTLLNSWPIPAWSNYGFCGGVFDGISVWLVPYDATQVVRIFTANYSMRGYGNWPLSGFSKGAAAFVGGIFDGSSIWLVPYNADRVVRLFTDNGTMVGYPNWPPGFSKVTKGFAGASFDGISLWMVPQNADQVVRFFCNNGSMVAYGDWAAAGLVKKTVAFSGGVIAAGSFWLFPFYADRLVQVSLDNGTMKGHNNWPTANGFSYSAGSFIGGVFDGIDSIWLVPYDSDRVVRFFVTNHTMVDYRVWPGGFTKSGNAFAGGTFDGEAVWFAPSTADVVVKIYVSNGTMIQYPIWPANYTVPSVAFRGALYDGQRVWMLPFEAKDVVVLNASQMECSTTSSLTPSASISLERSTPTNSRSSTPSASGTQSKLLTTTPHKTISLLLASRLSSQSHESLAVRPTSSLAVTYAISVDLTQTTPLTHPQGYGSPSPSETIPFTSGLVMNTPRPIGTDLAMPQTRVAVIVASAGSGAALVASSLSPTMATQASRPFVFLRAIDCKSQKAESTPISDDPEYLELPLQVALPKTSGPYPRYSGSLLVTVAVLLGVPGLLFTIANLLLTSEKFRNRKLLLKAQRSIFSTAFLMSVGYFIPTVWKVLVLVAGTHQTEGASVLQLAAVTGVALTATAIVGFLLYILMCRCPTEAQCRPHRTQNGKTSPEIPTPLHSRLELTPFLAAYGPLFEDLRSQAFPVRIYFAEELVISCLLQALDGVRPSNPPGCRGVAIAMTAIVLLHLIYLVLARPHRAKVELGLAFIGTCILLAMGVFAIVAIFSTDSSAIAQFSVSALGYLSLVESGYFYIQLIVLASFEIAKKHKQRVLSQWNNAELQPPTESKNVIETELEQRLVLPVPAAELEEHYSTADSSRKVAIHSAFNPLSL